MAFWGIRAGKSGEGEEIALAKNIVGIGWGELGDLSSLKSKDELVSRWRSVYPQAPDYAIARSSSMVWNLRHTVAKGDLIALPLKRRSAVAFGEITGTYAFSSLAPALMHTRAVRWLGEIQRRELLPDVRSSLGALQTIFRIRQPDAEERVRALLAGDAPQKAILVQEDSVPQIDIEQQSTDEIAEHIGRRFHGHELARLVAEILRAQGFVTESSEPGPDGGVDILASKGFLGTDRPRLCVQVRSGKQIVDVKVLREFQGVLQNFNADQGLIVSWGGFTSSAVKEARTKFFQIRLWDDADLVEALQQNYSRLSADIQAELPLKQIWVLVREPLNE